MPVPGISPVFFDRDENHVSRPGIHLALVRQPTDPDNDNDDGRISSLVFVGIRLNVGATALEIARLEGRALKKLFYVEYNGNAAHNSDHNQRNIVDRFKLNQIKLIS